MFFESKYSFKLHGNRIFVVFLLNFAIATVPRCQKPAFPNCTMEYPRTILWCDGTNLTTIPLPGNLVGSFHAPPEKSTVLMFNHSCVKTINPNALAHYSCVNALDLADNYIEVLRVRSFPNLVHLKELILASNRVWNIEDRSFDGLNKLRVLRLDHNHLESISDVTFRGLPSLEQLSLGHNKLQSLPHEAFRNLPNLKALDVSGNQLTEFLPDHVVRLSHLESLDLSGNQLTIYDSHVHQLVANRIKKLDLKNNSIGCFAEDAFDGGNLSDIDISNNPLKMPHYKWLSQSLSETRSFALSKSGAWICDCTVYSYNRKLSSKLPNKPLKKFDIECSEPPSLRGRMLSELDWNQLSLHSNCSVPDKYQPCLNVNHVSQATTASNSTITRAIATVKTTQAHISVQPFFSRKDLQKPNTQNSTNFEKIIIIIALATAIILVAFIAAIRVVRRCKAKKEAPKYLPKITEASSRLERSSKTDSVFEVPLSGNYEKPLSGNYKVPRSGYYTENYSEHQRMSTTNRSKTSMEVLISNPHETRAKHLVGSWPSITGSESTHGYASMTYPDSDYSGPQHSPPPQPPPIEVQNLPPISAAPQATIHLMISSAAPPGYVPNSALVPPTCQQQLYGLRIPVPPPSANIVPNS